MRIRNFRRILALGIGALLLSGSLAASPLSRPAIEGAATTPYSLASQKEASDLLAEMKKLTYDLSRNADTLAGLARGNQVGRQTHANYLNVVRGHVNELGDRLERLQAIRHATAPWQQQAIDRMVPAAVELAGRTEAAINHLNENRQFLSTEPYRDHVGVITDRADELNESVKAFAEFDQTQQKMERLQEQLEIAPS